MTTPTGPIVGTASVAITPSTTAFNQQLRAGLQNAQRAISDAADDMGDSIANQITAGAARARLALEAMTAGLDQRVNVTVSASKSLVTSLEGIGGSATKAGAAFGAFGLAIGNASFAVGALLGTLSELSGIMVGLPAVIGSAALIMGTLKVATQGVGEAFGAALSGDIEAITEASKDLAPAAQQLVSVVMDLDKRLDALKKTTQQAFFAPIAKEFRGFATQGTALAENALPRIATELGKISGEFLRVAQSGTFFRGLRTLVDETVSGLQRWQGVTGELANALGNLFQVGARFSGDMIAGVGGLIEQFSEWVNLAAQSGELERRLDSALAAFAQLGRIIGNVSDIFGAFWFSAQEAGASFLGVIEHITQSFATFLNSDLGIASLTSLMDAGATAASILGDVIDRLLPTLGQLTLTMSTTLVEALEIVAPAIRTLITGFEQLALNASGGIGDAITMLARGFAGLMESLTPLLPVIGEIIGLLAEHFAATVNIVISVVGDFLAALEPFLPQIKAIIDAGLEAFTDALTMLADAIMPLLPVLIDLGVNVLQLLADAFIVIMDVIEPFLPLLVQLATQVLTLVANHFAHLFEAIQPLAPIIVDLISSGLEVLADILPVIVDAFAPLLPIIVDVAKQVAKALAPALPAVADAFKEIFKALTPVLPQLAELTGQILVTGAELFTALVKAVLPLVPPLIEIGTEILRVLLPAFNDLLQAIIPILPVISDLAVKLLRDALLPVIEALLPVLPVFIDAFVQMLPSFVALLPPLTEMIIALTPLVVLLADFATVIAEVVLPVIALFVVALNELRSIAITLLAAAIDALVVTVKIAWDAIVLAIQVAWEIIKGIFDVIISLLQGDFTEAWNRFKDMIKEVWDKIKEFVSGAIGDIVDYLVEWGPKLYTAAKESLQRIWDAADEIFGGILGGLAEWFVEFAKWLIGFKGAIGKFFEDAGKWLWQAGKDIVQGLINGMAEIAKNIGSWVNDNIVNPIKNAIDGVKGFFTGSPSRWMAKRGEWVAQGLAEGIQKASGDAVSATVDMVTAVKAPVQASALTPTPNLAGLLGAATVAAPGATAGGTMQTSTVTFGQGAVVVSFEGVVPSEADALRTGQAVGRGILDVIAERDARLAVRVL